MSTYQTASSSTFPGIRVYLMSTRTQREGPRWSVMARDGACDIEGSLLIALYYPQVLLKQGEEGGINRKLQIRRSVLFNGAPEIAQGDGAE
jgi:hypothetical protein